MTNLQKIGKLCAQVRRANDIPRREVAKTLHYSVENIARFERGENDNVLIFLWYCNNGVSISEVLSLVG